jgi:hypothetical protein
MTCIYRRNDAELAAEQFEDGLVIINFLTGRYFSMNSTAEVIWTLLEHGCSSDELAVRLNEHCVVPATAAARLTADVGEFLAKLVQERLVCSDATTAVSPVVSLPAAQLPYEIPQIEVFEDLADLILLDPIHDVNEQLGWPAVRTVADGE